MAMATCRWPYRLTIVCGLLLFRCEQPLVVANQHPPAPAPAPAHQQHNFVDSGNAAAIGFEINGMLLPLLLLVVVLAVGKGAGLRDGPHLYHEKSMARAVRDCMEYLQIPAGRYADYTSHRFPSDPETQCLVRCVGLSLRWWNDTTGVQPALMANFFQPDSADADYERRTAKCLEVRLAASDPSDCCGAAYESFMCYLQHYGNLVAGAQFLPEDHSRHVRMAYDCMHLLQVPEALLRSYGAGDIRDASDTRCLLRCFYLRSGVYRSESGFDLERLYSRDFEHPDARYLAPETYAKLHNLRSSGCDECTEVFLAYRGLLGELGNAYYEDGVLREAAVLALRDGHCGKARHHAKQPNEATTHGPRKHYKKHPTKPQPAKCHEAGKTTHGPEKRGEEPPTTAKDCTHPPTTTTRHEEHEASHGAPSTTPCPATPREEPTTTPATATATATTESPVVVFDYKKKNCENYSKMFKPNGSLMTCPCCRKSYTKHGGFECCADVQGSCKAACENLSLARIASEPGSREAKLADVRKYCPLQQQAPFWRCMNETLAAIQRGAAWPGRVCCPLAMSVRCQHVCATGSSRDELAAGCRASDEQSLFGCLKRQEDGHRCCSSARTSECVHACSEVFQRYRTPSRAQREEVLAACRTNNSNVMQCIKGFIDVTSTPNLKRYVPCCDSSPEPQCRRVCRETLTAGGPDAAPYTVEEIIDLLQHRGGCGALMPTLPLWKCFLEADRQRAAGQQLNSNEVSRINQIGMDSAKQHCCLKAVSLRCRLLCSTTFANEWTLDDLEQECLGAPEEHALRQCIDEVDEPCELGCDGLSFCSNFNNRPTELFRSCRAHSDMAARADVQQWRRQGFLPFPGGVQLPIRNETECSFEIWRSIACAAQIKPCTKDYHTNHICRQDCAEVLRNCVDWLRMPGGHSVSSLCQRLSPQNSSMPCISMGTFQLGGPAGAGLLEPSLAAAAAAAAVSGDREPPGDVALVSPCKGNPCNSSQVCVANRDGTYGYRCVDGCPLGEASSYLVPVGTFVRIPVSVAQKGCLKVCRCGQSGRIEKCQPLPCISYNSCTLAGRRFAHLSHFYVECNVCSCYAEEITCTKRQCRVPGRTEDRAFTSLPCNCPPHYVPVCGRNGNTYPSACVAKCAGVPDGDIEFGPCRARNGCDRVDCGPLSVCLPEWNVCLSGMHKPCPQYRCVNLTSTNCSTITDVRDTDLGYHANLCEMVLARATYAYREKYRKHCDTSRRRSQVCGVNGVTYRSECEAWSDYSTVDYNGPCQEVGLISPQLQARCASIKCPKRKAHGCTPVLPPGACCPVCGTAVRIVYSRKQIDRGLYALKGASTDYLTLRSIMRSLEALLQTVECRLAGQLTFENDLYVIVETLSKNPARLQTQICAREAERLVTLVRTQSHRITSELNLSALTVATLATAGNGGAPRPEQPHSRGVLVLAVALGYLLGACRH